MRTRSSAEGLKEVLRTKTLSSWGVCVFVALRVGGTGVGLLVKVRLLVGERLYVAVGENDLVRLAVKEKVSVRVAVGVLLGKGEIQGIGLS